MVGLLGLPDEILIVIASHLSHDQKSLRALHLVHPRFKIPSMIFMYRQVKVDPPKSLGVQMLAYYLASDPTKASYVQDLTILEGWELNMNNEIIVDIQNLAKDSQRMTTVEEVRKQMRKSALGNAVLRCSRLGSADLDGLKGWLADMYQGKMDPWIALILLLVPNITKLNITLIPDSPYTDRFVFARVGTDFVLPSPFPSTSTEPLFPRLKTLVIEQADPIRFTRVVPFFKLPSMREFTGERIWGKRLPNDQCWPVVGSSRVELIDLPGCNGMDGLLDIVGVCANLKHLRYEHEYEVIGGSNGPSSEINSAVFLSSIQSIKHSLNTLIFDYYDPSSNHGGLGNRFISLASFNMLRTLWIRDVNLFKTPVAHFEEQRLRKLLPGALVKFGICNSNLPPTFVQEQLEDLLVHKRNSFPNLRLIFLAFVDHETPLDRLRLLCRENQVDFHIADADMRDRYFWTPGKWDSFVR